MTKRIDPPRPRAAPTRRIGRPLDLERATAFAPTWIETFRRGIAQESIAALLLARQLGLELPCAHPTT